MLEEPLRIHGMRGAGQRRERVLEVMSEVGLPAALYDELPLGLSAGQRQRVNVARAMVLGTEGPDQDETLSSLDQTEQFKLLKLFETLQAQHNLTYVFISHDLAMVRRVCNRIAVMYLGEVVEIAGNGRLFFDPGHPYSRALLSAVPTLEEAGGTASRTVSSKASRRTRSTCRRAAASRAAVLTPSDAAASRARP